MDQVSEMGLETRNLRLLPAKITGINFDASSRFCMAIPVMSDMSDFIFPRINRFRLLNS
jgi:hypothetical protein